MTEELHAWGPESMDKIDVLMRRRDADARGFAQRVASGDGIVVDFDASTDAVVEGTRYVPVGRTVTITVQFPKELDRDQVNARIDDELIDLEQLADRACGDDGGPGKVIGTEIKVRIGDGPSGSVRVAKYLAGSTDWVSAPWAVVLGIELSGDMLNAYLSKEETIAVRDALSKVIDLS